MNLTLIAFAVPAVLLAVGIVLDIPGAIRSYRKRKSEKKRIDDALKRAYLLRDRMTDDEIVEAFTSWGVFRDPATARVTITRFLEHCNKTSAED